MEKGRRHILRAADSSPSRTNTSLETQSQKAGEDVLRLTTRILNGAVREMDLIGRYDHDCFSFLLPRTTLQRGIARGPTRVVNASTSSVPSSNRGPEHFTLSVGVAEVAEGDDVVRLLQRAEAAMSAAETKRTSCHTGQRPEVVAMVPQIQTLDLSATPGMASFGDAVSAT